ncbi:MAG TPA: hypothetical protein VFR56_02420 [Actinomycetes bacterium]|nr:hypothetical protein [Actinomycetes bacterium]
MTTQALAGGALDESLLGVVLPRGEPAQVLRLSGELSEAADRLLAVAQGAARLLPVAGWSGVAAAGADRRLLEVAAAVGAERSRLQEAAGALRGFGHELGTAVERAVAARALLATARRVQDDADARDRALSLGLASGQWAGPRSDGRFTDPDAVLLLDRARRLAREAREAADRAASRLVHELTRLSGRRVLRDGGSWRPLLDVAGLVPGYGDVLDLGSAAVYGARGDWWDAAVSGAAAVPGPLGWLAGATRAGRAADHVGEVARVVDDSPRGRAAAAFASVPTRGDRAHVRLLADDAAVDQFWWDVLAPLGWTNVRRVDKGWVTTTHLPDGSRIVHRDFSTSGGHAIELQSSPLADVRKIHTSDGGATGGA